MKTNPKIAVALAKNKKKMSQTFRKSGFNFVPVFSRLSTVRGFLGRGYPLFLEVPPEKQDKYFPYARQYPITTYYDILLQGLEKGKHVFSLGVPFSREFFVSIVDGKVISCREKESLKITDRESKWSERQPRYVFSGLEKTSLLVAKHLGINFGAVRMGWNACRNQLIILEIIVPPELHEKTKEGQTAELLKCCGILGVKEKPPAEIKMERYQRKPVVRGVRMENPWE